MCDVKVTIEACLTFDEFLKAVAEWIAGRRVTGIAVTPGPTTVRPHAGESDMATPKIKLVKKSQAKMGAAKSKADPGSFTFQDNEDGSYTVQGTDAAGFAVDIGGVATLTAASDNAAVMTADAPTGMTGAVHGLTPGSANLTLVATWGDGSVGPFTVTVPCTVAPGPVTGLGVTFGPPTVR